ncbi:MAG: primosomal protein N' [Chloroflexota bacterium]|nr:primosomal protein N' [Chloroflexota bacterium]
MYAEVAVHTPMARRLDTGNAPESPDAPLGMTFHYSIPASLAGTLARGHLVWVPFGKQQLHGIVFDLVDNLPDGVEKLRSVLDLAMPEPVCTPAQLELARWMSRAYLAPVLDCLLLMLPPGLAQKAEPVLFLTANAMAILYAEPRQAEAHQPQETLFDTGQFSIAPESARHFPDLKPAQQQLLDLLLERGQITERVLSHRHPDLARRSVINPLVDQGLLARQRRIVEPPPRPKTGKLVTLIANQETIDQVLPTLGRKSKQADVLTWLAGSADQSPPLKIICQAVGCSPAPVKSLEERAWVQIEPEQRTIELAVSRETAQASLEGELSRSDKQAHALRALLDHHEGERVDERMFRQKHSINTNTLAALERRGTIRRMSTEARVRLLLKPSNVPDRLIELRGGEKYRRVMTALSSREEPVWIGWLYAEANADLAMLRVLDQAGLISLSEREIWRDPLAGKVFVADKPPPLTDDQAQVWRTIERAIRAREEREPQEQKIGEATLDAPGEQLPGTPAWTRGGDDRAFLLHGVTGSGKTEIYLRAIDATLKAGRQAIILVPEIALTPQTVRRFAARFDEKVTVYHSGLSAGERYDVWRRCRSQSGGPDVVIGTRSALYLPMAHLGLIVLDEEHDPSFKETQRPPRYHARDAALQLGRLTGSTVILGSATPSLESYHAAQLGELTLLTLPRRIMGHALAIAEQQQRLKLDDTIFRPLRTMQGVACYTDLPPVQVVDLRQELRAGNRSIFSRALQQALDQTLQAGQQAILYLNRRGSATFVMCRDCGHVLTCDNCDVPLTYHESKTQSTRATQLLCHHCGKRELSPERCPSCGSRRIRYLGAGTRRIAELVETLWPQARTLRWDRDVTGRKGSHDAILDKFSQHEADVMVGTQMIAKGLDLPLVTLVGVISADVGLYLPDFRAAERSFQLLTQVAGRAGRSLLGGQVILQSYRPEHYVIQAARRHDYLDFVRQELGYRRELHYPPFRRLAKLVYSHKKQERARSEAEALARGLSFAIQEQNLAGIDLIGPAPCFFGRERQRYRWQILVRASDPVVFLRTVSIPQGWRVDVDPVSVL